MVHLMWQLCPLDACEFHHISDYALGWTHAPPLRIAVLQAVGGKMTESLIAISEIDELKRLS
jgi:hypothetical protein